MSNTDKTSGGSTANGSGGGGLASLGKGAKWLGGIVVVAVVGALTPMLLDNFKPEPKLDAELDNVSILKPVSLDEFKIRQENQFAMFGGGSAPRIRLVAAYAHAPPVADAPAAVAEGVGEDAVRESKADEQPDPGGENTTPDEQTTTPDEQTTTPDEQTTTPDEQTTTPGDETTTPDPGSSARREGIDELAVPPNLSHADREAMTAGVQQAIRTTSGQLNLEVPAACVQDPTDESCGLRSLQQQLGVSGEQGADERISTEQVAGQLVRVFKGTRTQPSPDDPGKRELVGVTVDFDITMTGFRGKIVDVRWSLIGAGGKRVPRPWLRNQLALKLKGEADDDSGTGGFWVPIPENRGPFFIRISVYNDKGARIDFADTRRFR